MSLSHDDLERLDERYAKKEEFTNIRLEIDARITKIEKSIEVIRTRLNTTIGVLTTIAIPVLAIAVKYLFGA